MSSIEALLNAKTKKPAGETIGHVIVNDPKKSGIPLELQTQNRKPSAAVSPQPKKNDLAPIVAKAIESGATKITKVPEGKRALTGRVPASVATDRSPGMKRLRESGKASEIASKHTAEIKQATEPKKTAKTAPAKTAAPAKLPAKTAKPAAKKTAAKPATGSTRKPTWYKEDDGKRAVQMFKRQNGALSSEVQKELKWKAIIVRRFVRDVVRNKMKLRVKTVRADGETRYTVIG